MSFHNQKAYLAYIQEKYDKTKKIYKRVFTDKDSPEIYLLAYEATNVYPTYPRPIICPIKKRKDDWKLPELQAATLEFAPLHKLMKPLNEELETKLKEYASYIPKFAQVRNFDKVRRFFDYEIRDAIREKQKAPSNRITNAWVKMYEILVAYKFFDKQTSIKSFHICEHPGAFIFAIEDYAKKHGIKHDYVFQSLKPGSDRQIFKPDPSLPMSKLDYGKHNGDITNAENIRYYIQKYKDQDFGIVTSDCGLDCSDDLNEQENKLYKIFLGAAITALGVSKKGAHYVFKMFSFNQKTTLQLMQILCYFYESVDVVRLLTDKGGSGEVYLICTSLKANVDDKTIEKLLLLIEKPHESVISQFEPKFIKRVTSAHALLTMRRITNMNSLIFRFNNLQFAEANPEVKTYVKHFADYYVNYFLTFIGAS